MTLRLDDKWVWDFWLAQDGTYQHVYYLQAPRALADPEMRHHNATVGHAVSTNLTDWEVLPDALHPGPSGSWDDLAVWTGSVIAHDGLWYMLYTGISSAEAGLVQRIGLAVSSDLVHWHKDARNPVLEADPHWYETRSHTRSRQESWRDPYLVRVADDDLFHALITARVATGPDDGAGVVAHAHSKDLVSWEIDPPITLPGEVAQAEVPQLVRLEDGYRLLVSCHAEDHSQLRRERLGRPGQTGTFALYSNSPLGPFDFPSQPVLPANSPVGTGYAGKLVSLGPDDTRFMCFIIERDGEFVGELCDPLPVDLQGSEPFATDAQAAAESRSWAGLLTDEPAAT
ncbi:MAG: glycosyl hydrolase family 32 [Solirubrobacteraceae bacterium]